MTDQNDTIENKFKTFLGTKIPGARDIIITNFTRKTEGFSYETYLMEIERWERNIEKFRIVPQPFLKEVNTWLKRNMPQTPFFTLTHGDFRVGNFIWRDERIVAFLDWEMPGIGDPMMDLAWICWKLLRPDDPNLMCMLIEREELYRIYEELTGTKVDEERVFYWEVLSNYKQASISISAVRACSDGKNRDARLVPVAAPIYYFCLKDLVDLLKF